MFVDLFNFMDILLTLSLSSKYICKEKMYCLCKSRGIKLVRLDCNVGYKGARWTVFKQSDTPLSYRRANNQPQLNGFDFVNFNFDMFVVVNFNVIYYI